MARLIPLAAADAAGTPATPTAARAGFKAARLASALRAGLPVLPGFVRGPLRANDVAVGIVVGVGFSMLFPSLALMVVGLSLIHI